jgi:hypothetical protein
MCRSFTIATLQVYREVWRGRTPVVARGAATSFKLFAWSVVELKTRTRKFFLDLSQDIERVNKNVGTVE